MKVNVMSRLSSNRSGYSNDQKRVVARITMASYILQKSCLACNVLPITIILVAFINLYFARRNSFLSILVDHRNRSRYLVLVSRTIACSHIGKYLDLDSRNLQRFVSYLFGQPNKS